MSPQQLPGCPHDVRPGTTICLHCRHDARMLARGRRRAVLVRLGVGAAGVAALGVALIGGASVIQARLASSGAPSKHVAAKREAADSAVMQAGSVADVPAMPGAKGSTSAASAGGPPQQQSVALRVADRNPSPALATTLPRAGALATPPGPTLEPAPVPRGAPLVPVLQEGRTDFADGVFAERAGNNVMVHFDTPATRTRRRDKLEQIVRATLPRVYGSTVDSALAKIPTGGLTNGRDPVSELPSRGMWVPLDKGWTLAVWPQTRPGQDGPLIVTYRVAVMH